MQIGTASNWATVSATRHNNLAVRTDGTLWAWGNNFSGQIGNGTGGTVDDYVTRPVQVGTATNWKSASAGQTASFAIRTDGTLWAWGDNTNYRLGLGDTVDRHVPVQVGTATNWATVSAD